MQSAAQCDADELTKHAEYCGRKEPFATDADRDAHREMMYKRLIVSHAISLTTMLSDEIISLRLKIQQLEKRHSITGLSSKVKAKSSNATAKKKNIIHRSRVVASSSS